MSASEEATKVLMGFTEDPVAAAFAAAAEEHPHQDEEEVAGGGGGGEPSNKKRPKKSKNLEKDFVKDGPPIAEPLLHDVLNGRGAFVNAHEGNKTFRSLCFAKKVEFENGNHPVKRRVAVEIVNAIKNNNGRFLKRKDPKGPWYELTTEKAIFKAQQVIRDFQRPDRAERNKPKEGARKRQRLGESTPGASEAAARLTEHAEPIMENPFGVHDHDVLSGRGAFVACHTGNKRLRQLAIQRKGMFEAGNYAEKRNLAQEIVNKIKALNPPGRFLKQVTPAMVQSNDGKPLNTVPGLDGDWIQLSDEKAIHKACQVMRDLDRPDRAARGLKKHKNATGGVQADGIAMLAETTTNAEEVVEDAVKATEDTLASMRDVTKSDPESTAAV